MAELANHLVENIIPWVPMRQYVLTVPIALRYWMASNKNLCSAIYRIFAAAVNGFYIEPGTQSGSVTFTQRFGSALNLNVHFHLIQIEGIYEKKSTGLPKFKRTKIPIDDDIGNLLKKISQQVITLLEKENYLHPEEIDEPKLDQLFEEDPLYAECMSASLQYKIATGERRGLPVRKLGGGFGRSDEFLQITGRLCASVNGFTLHAARFIPRHQRQTLEQLIQYAARPALAISRLSLTTEGLIKYELKTPWKDGTTHIMLSAMEFIEKLVALIPLPRMHLVRYFGVLSPNSKLRKTIIPGKTRAEIKKEKEGMTEDEQKSLRHSSWGKLLARIFSIDISVCPKCNGEMRIISAILNRTVITEILTHLNLAARPPPVSPPRIREFEFAA